MSKLGQYGDALERVVWTGLEGAGAVGIVAFARQYIELDEKWWALAVIVLGVLLAAGKTAIATSHGTGSAALGLPVDAEPVPAQSVALTVARAVGDSTPNDEAPIVDFPPDPRDRDGDGHDDVNGRFI